MSPVPPGYHMPAEWAPHEACWLAWPSDESLWQENLGPAQDSFTQLCRALADVDPATGQPRGERLEVLVPDEAREQEARRALEGLGARFHRIPFGDIWLRDTAPLFLEGEAGRLSVRFGFNGWGGKYVLEHDGEVSARIAQASGLPAHASPWVLEGGSVEVDGEGTVLTTRQCLLNPNRNPGATQEQVEEWLKESLGAKKVLWLEEGLLNDHTDGHVDTLARFVGPGLVVCMEAREAGDPNRAVLESLGRELESLTDAQGRKLAVVRVPSPGTVLDEQGRVMPASYVNFYIGNRAVVVPTYGSPYDSEAVEQVAALFPGRRTVGVAAKAILSGGGAFHCITQQQPGTPPWQGGER